MIEPVKLTLFERMVTSVLVTVIGTSTVNSATVDVLALNTKLTAPEELNEPGWKLALLSTTVPDFVAEKLKPPEPAATEDGAVALLNIATERRGPDPVIVIRLPINS